MYHFVTEFTEILQPFTQLNSFVRDRLPTIDVEAMLDMLMEHVGQGVTEPWHDYVRELVCKGYLLESFHLSATAPGVLAQVLDARGRWENIPVQGNDSELLIDAIAQVGMALEAHLMHFGIYRNGSLNYVYQGCIRHDLYEFVRKPDA